MPLREPLAMSGSARRALMCSTGISKRLCKAQSLSQPCISTTSLLSDTDTCVIQSLHYGFQSRRTAKVGSLVKETSSGEPACQFRFWTIGPQQLAHDVNRCPGIFLDPPGLTGCPLSELTNPLI